MLWCGKSCGLLWSVRAPLCSCDVGVETGRQRWRETKRESERDTEGATTCQRKWSTSFKEMKTYGLLRQGLGEPHQENVQLGIFISPFCHHSGP